MSLLYFSDYNTCTSGFVILGGSEVRTASVVLDLDDVTEEAIRRKFSALVRTETDILVKENLLHPLNSLVVSEILWLILLSKIG
jgi:hypothetical protein